MNIRDYIESGSLEAFVLGVATEQEVKELLYMKARYPEVNEALKQLEWDMEKMAGDMSITPPPHVWDKIEHEITEVIPHQDTTPLVNNRHHNNGKSTHQGKPAEEYIEVEGASSHMRVHKIWRWLFIGVFVLSKVFLAFAIYFYLENRQMKEQLQEIKTEVRQLKNSRR